ncbi:transposase, partial [Xanthomonas fragariae]|uniref:transposase n=1 Tax=Xanthomonas fragariae TaxID=48664 RepID=UPI0013A57005
IVDAQSVKNTDTAGQKGYDAGKRCRASSGISLLIPRVPHAIAVTTAEVTDRKGALRALERCQSNLTHVQSLLCDSGYTGVPFAEGVREILGEQLTVQIAKRSELHTFKVMPKRWIVERSFACWRKTEGCGRTASADSTPACSSSIWPSWRFYSKDREQALSHET